MAQPCAAASRKALGSPSRTDVFTMIQLSERMRETSPESNWSMYPGIVRLERPAYCRRRRASYSWSRDLPRAMNLNVGEGARQLEEQLGALAAVPAREIADGGTKRFLHCRR